MQSKAHTVEEYISELPEERNEVMSKLRDVISHNIPEGFVEQMSYGMIGYVVPHSLYPAGYHCNSKLPLPFISIASQKSFIALYHMGMYADKKLLDWFVSEYPKYSQQKLDIGKSCVRFKKLDQLPYELIAMLVQEMTVNDWVILYETILTKPK